MLEQLTIKKLKRSDEGIYKVLNEDGLSVSTVQLSVSGENTFYFTHYASFKRRNTFLKNPLFHRENKRHAAAPNI